MATYQVKQSSTSYPLVFLMVQSSDHITGLTGASPTVTISKSGGAFASPSGTVTEIANGWYKVAGNATDSATLGPLALHATAASGDPCDELYEVVAVDPQSTAFGLSLAKTTNITGFNDIAATAIVSTGAITTSSGAVSTVTTVTNQLTAAAIATGVWQDSTSGDFTAASSIGKSLYTSGNAPGAASGLALVGSNVGAATSVSGAVGSVTGNVGGNVVGSVASVTAAVTISLTQALSAARNVGSVADTSLTLNDAMHCAIASAAGQKDASGGTTYTVSTPSTGTLLRSYTLTLISPPSTVPDKAV